MSKPTASAAPRNSSNNLSQKKSWRDHLKVHPAADLFPMMSEAELRELGENIKAHGLRSPIVLCAEHGITEDPTQYSLLDGRNRLDAMALVSIPFELTFERQRRGRFKEWTLDTPESERPLMDSNENPILVEVLADPYEYVISANIHRRHLTAEQRRDLIAKVLQASPEKSDRAIADQMKVDKNVVSRVRQKVEATGAVAPVEKRTGKDGRARKQPEKKQKTAESQRKEEPPSFDKGACHSLEWNEIEGQAETLISVWDKTGPKLRRDFVRARKVEIMRAQQEIGKSAHEPDDGLDIPGFLKRDTKAGAA